MDGQGRPITSAALYPKKLFGAIKQLPHQAAAAPDDLLP